MDKIAGIILAFFCFASQTVAQIRYVRFDISVSGNGQAWSTAYKTLQEALTEASQSGSGITQIWIKTGTYVPSLLTNPLVPRSATFRLISGVSLYGGFDGTETSLGQRDPDARSTLDGGGRYRVVTALSDVASVVTLDQLIITGGYNDSLVSGISQDGAGVYAPGAKLSLNRCRIASNLALGTGGGLYSVGGEVAITSCYIDNNFAPFGGGAGAVIWDTETLVISDTVFYANNSELALGATHAAPAGALMLSEITSVVISNCVFEDNSAGSQTGGAPGGAIRAVGVGMVISDTQFIGNRGASGGAISGTSVVLEIANCNFDTNIAYVSRGGAIELAPSPAGNPRLEAMDCRFDGNSAGSEAQRASPYCDLNPSGGAVNCSHPIVLIDCAFGLKGGNTAAGAGGAVHAPVELIENCTFVNNMSYNKGGAISIDEQPIEGAVIVGVTFKDNWARGRSEGAWCRGGGAVSLGTDTSDSPVTFVNCIFAQNVAGESSASGMDPEADVRGGAVRTQGNNVWFQNCVFESNVATGEGGALAADGPDSEVKVDTSTLGLNSSQQCGGAISTSGCTVQNSIVWGNTAGGSCSGTTQLKGFGTIYYSCLQQVGGQDPANWSLSNIVTANPLFKNTGVPTVDDVNLRLAICSPAINAGNNSLIPVDALDLDGDSNTTETLPYDVSGRPRIKNSVVNLGAYEDCPADIDDSGALTANDFGRFLDMYAAGSHVANFDCSTGSPLLTANDFQAFLNAYSVGCN